MNVDIRNWFAYLFYEKGEKKIFAWKKVNDFYSETYLICREKSGKIIDELVTARHDLGLLYSRSLLNIQSFVEDAAEMYIENGWMEKPPHAADRDHIASDK